MGLRPIIMNPLRVGFYYMGPKAPYKLTSKGRRPLDKAIYICSYEGPSALLLEQILVPNEGAKPLHIDLLYGPAAHIMLANRWAAGPSY